MSVSICWSCKNNKECPGSQDIEKIKCDYYSINTNNNINNDNFKEIKFKSEWFEMRYNELEERYKLLTEDYFDILSQINNKLKSCRDMYNMIKNEHCYECEIAKMDPYYCDNHCKYGRAREVLVEYENKLNK